MKYILCWLGLHNWSVALSKAQYGYIRCARCGKTIMNLKGNMKRPKAKYKIGQVVCMGDGSYGRVTRKEYYSNNGIGWEYSVDCGASYDYAEDEAHMRSLTKKEFGQ